MSEFEVWSVLTGFLISNAIYTAAVFFMVWVAFRAANQTAAEGGSLVAKILVTLFACCVTVDIIDPNASTANDFQVISCI